MDSFEDEQFEGQTKHLKVDVKLANVPLGIDAFDQVFEVSIGERLDKIAIAIDEAAASINAIARSIDGVAAAIEQAARAMADANRITVERENRQFG